MTRILVPPGIGDIYWVMVKLRGFCRAHGIKDPEIWIDAPNDRKRSIGFIERITFVKAGGYFCRSGDSPATAMAGRRKRLGIPDATREEAYTRDGRHAFRGIDGFDWFLSFNGSINAGRSLDEVEPQWPAEWDIPFMVTAGEAQYGAVLRASAGPYVVAAFFDAGFYRRWLAELPPADIYEMLSRIHDGTGRRIILTGASWDDSPLNRALMDMDSQHGRILSLIGETTLEQYFGALRASDGCIGFPAGNTMMGAVFGRPTAIIWNKFFDRRMWRNALPPHLRNYAPLDTALGAQDIADSFIGMLHE